MWWTLFVGAAIFLYDVFKTVSTVLGVAFLIRFFIIQPFYISGSSMEPTFHNNQYIIVDQLTPRFNDYHRGDVVVFKYPRNPAFQYIKRVVGLPGEKVEIADGHVVIYNAADPQGIVVDEPYTNPPTRPLGKTSFTIPEGSYFVMGDNRPNSSDSRDFGPVARNLIVGRVQLVLYPFDQFESVHRPVYGKGL
jgi:signal peptidase I